MNNTSDVPSASEARLDHLINVIEKLCAQYENIDIRLASKCDVEVAEKLQARMQQLEERFCGHEHEVDQKIKSLGDRIQSDVTDCVPAKVHIVRDDEAIKQMIQEEVTKLAVVDKDIENRKRNIIVYRVPEKKMDNVADRKESDEVFTSDLLDGVFNIKLEPGDIEKTYRLGYWAEDKSRPLLVGFKNYEQKQHIMANFRNLKTHSIEKFCGIGISHDLHPKQREENKRMVEAAKQEFAEEGTGDLENYKFLVVGQGSKKRVIKVRKN